MTEDQRFQADIATPTRHFWIWSCEWEVTGLNESGQRVTWDRRRLWAGTAERVRQRSTNMALASGHYWQAKHGRFTEHHRPVTVIDIESENDHG